ncbi:TolC family protein [Thiobacillus denitrificans]|jgi:outer membrane protein TolC|uniref:TolC family protein n=1 Tax=Thiobacillus denitrificans TaxID=36861 RepID=UPI000477D775|nr:TolC family protein [Thiobacillus denitrificans]
MSRGRTAGSLRLLWAIAASILALPAWAQEAPLPGGSVDSLLTYAREHNPEYAAMRLEADAAGERAASASALPDPKLRIELRDITRFGEQNPSLSPGNVGSTRYLLMQDVPWFGKRALKRQVAELDAEGVRGQVMGNWAELSARIKSAYAQLYYVHRNERYTREVLDLLSRLEKIARVRYAGGLSAQQDAIRAQVEQTGMKTELVSLENERRQLQVRMNALLARPAGAPLGEPEQLRPVPIAAKLDHSTLDARVRARNPQLFSEEARIRSAETSRELAYRNRYPDFTLGVSPIQYQNAVREWELMVELNLPLQQTSRRARERESESLLRAARARAEAVSNQILAELAGHLAGIEAARRTDTLIASSLLPQAELTFRAALAGYENGRLDFATLLDAQRQILQARLNQLKAQVEVQVRLAEIERLLGEDL